MYHILINPITLLCIGIIIIFSSVLFFYFKRNFSLLEKAQIDQAHILQGFITNMEMNRHLTNNDFHQDGGESRQKQSPQSMSKKSNNNLIEVSDDSDGDSDSDSDEDSDGDSDSDSDSDSDDSKDTDIVADKLDIEPLVIELNHVDEIENIHNIKNIQLDNNIYLEHSTFEIASLEELSNLINAVDDIDNDINDIDDIDNNDGENEDDYDNNDDTDDDDTDDDDDEYDDTCDPKDEHSAITEEDMNSDNEVKSEAHPEISDEISEGEVKKTVAVEKLDYKSLNVQALRDYCISCGVIQQGDKKNKKKMIKLLDDMNK